MRKGSYFALYSLVFSSMACAGDMGAASSLADNNYFLGLGGNYNSANLEKQTIYGKGVNSAYSGAVLASSGSAAGTSSPFYQKESLFSPHAQVGYVKYY